MLKRAQEPETLSEIIVASVTEKNRERKHTYEEKLQGVDEELVLKKLAEFIVVESASLNKEITWFAWLGIGLPLLFTLTMVFSFFQKWEVSGLFFFLMISPSSVMEFFQLRRRAAVGLAIKKVVQLTRMSRAGFCVGPVLDALDSTVDKSLQAELLECLRLPLSRIDVEQAALLTARQLKTLERLVVKEADSEVTIAGLLTLGAAGYRVSDWEKVRSWSMAPERLGRAAREYISSLGSVVG